MIYNDVTDVVSNNLALGTCVTFGPGRDPFLHNQTNTSSNLCSNSCTLKFRPIIMISVSTLHSQTPSTERNLATDQSRLGVHTRITQLIICRNICGEHTHTSGGVERSLCRSSAALCWETHAPASDGSCSVFRIFCRPGCWRQIEDRVRKSKCWFSDLEMI